MWILARYLSWALLLVFVATISVAAGEPVDLVKSAAEDAIKLLKDPKLKSPEKKKERIERLKEIINPIFDYQEMARRSMGRHWRKRTPAEQEEFYRLFRSFLEKVYSNKVDFYDGERVTFGRQTIDGDFAEVESAVTDSKGVTSPVVYRLKRIGGHWKVYDAVVENISIVNNYRSQFDRVLSKSSYAELRRLLIEKAG